LVALIGPNGAGKSTFLKAVLGQRDYDGVIAFSAPGQRERRPRIGYVPQSPAFDPGDPVSVADLFACCMSRRPAFFGLSKAMRSKVLECLDRVHGEDLIDKRVGTLSGGELQRVLLALALSPQPDLLILDEPVSGVDQNGLEEFYQTVDELKHKNHMAILLVSHDLGVVERYADRVVLMQGTVVKQGAASAVFASPEFEQVFYATRGGHA
jgi:zinc transport system ATP-binding protein